MPNFSLHTATSIKQQRAWIWSRSLWSPSFITMFKTPRHGCFPQPLIYSSSLSTSYSTWRLQSVCPHKHVKSQHYLPSAFRCNVLECEISSSVTKCRYSVGIVAVRRGARWRDLLIAHGISGLWEENCCLSSADGGGWCYEQCREFRCSMEMYEGLVYFDWPKMAAS